METDPTQKGRIEDKETVVQAAAQLPDGEIFTGQGHTEIFAKIAIEKPDMLEGIKEGFVTSRGRFVSRQEAGKIAFIAKQIPEEEPDLTSQLFNYYNSKK